MKRLFTAVLIAFGLLGFFLWAGAAAVKASYWCPHCDLTGKNSSCTTDQNGNTTCSCSGNRGGCGASCPAGYYPCNRRNSACCEIGIHPKRPDKSGCEAGNYMGSCYKCNVQCKDGECWEVCKTHDWTCCPCSSLDIDPDNLTATPVSETSVRLNWTPKGSFNNQGVQWDKSPTCPRRSETCATRREHSCIRGRAFVDGSFLGA